MKGLDKEWQIKTWERTETLEMENIIFEINNLVNKEIKHIWMGLESVKLNELEDTDEDTVQNAAQETSDQKYEKEDERCEEQYDKVTGITGGLERENKKEAVFEETMTENSAELLDDTNLLIQ